MDLLDTFDEYLIQSQVQIPIIGFMLNLVMTAFLTLVLKHVYVRYGNVLSNRNLFGKTLLLIAMTTMLIITIVKSSLALSLGLVGALSIIRFRAAIKEPEELAYLFLAISIGLGLGANQGYITTVALGIILAIIIITKKYSPNDSEANNMNVSIMSDNPKGVEVDAIIDILNQYCTEVSIKRLDESSDIFEASFLVSYENHTQLIETKKAIRDMDDNLRYTFLDNNSLI